MVIPARAQARIKLAQIARLVLVLAMVPALARIADVRIVSKSRPKSVCPIGFFLSSTPIFGFTIHP